MNLPASLPRVWVCPVLSNHFTFLASTNSKIQTPSQPVPRHPLLALPPQTALRVALASAAGLPCQLVVAPGISGGSFAGWAIGCVEMPGCGGKCWVVHTQHLLCPEISPARLQICTTMLPASVASNLTYVFRSTELWIEARWG